LLPPKQDCNFCLNSGEQIPTHWWLPEQHQIETFLSTTLFTELVKCYCMKT